MLDNLSQKTEITLHQSDLDLQSHAAANECKVSCLEHSPKGNSNDFHSPQRGKNIINNLDKESLSACTRTKALLC